MKTILLTLLSFLLNSIICNAQVDSFSKALNECGNYAVADSIVLFDNLRNFTIKLPKKWNGKFIGDLNRLNADKTSGSSKIILEGSSAYDTLGDTYESTKKDPNFEEVHFIGSQEIAILHHPKGMYNGKVIHKYQFYFEIKDNPWVWNFYLAVINKELTKKDFCEIKHIINQYIQQLRD